ncbi:MAG: transcriptional regulator, TetR family [Proteobacteria bacterium]|nr:transcriptional regulator, TetR family [Pseudomonadota bacterium]
MKDEESATRKPLDRHEWIEGAIDALADEGVAGMRVESLAKRFGVTKGSFYWHFRDRQDLVDAVLQAWKAGRIGGSDAPAAQAREQLLQIIDVDGSDRKDVAIELAVRDWARRDAQAGAVVEAVDRYRLESASRLFVACGLGDKEAKSRSVLLYAYLLGLSLMAFDRHDPKIVDAKRWIVERIVPDPVDS